MKQKCTTMHFFKHLDHQQISDQKQVKGFSFAIDDFNKVVLNGCVPQGRKRCKETQTDPRDFEPRPKSPSVFSKEFQQM